MIDLQVLSRISGSQRSKPTMSLNNRTLGCLLPWPILVKFKKWSRCLSIGLLRLGTICGWWGKQTTFRKKNASRCLIWSTPLHWKSTSNQKHRTKTILTIVHREESTMWHLMKRLSYQMIIQGATPTLKSTNRLWEQLATKLWIVQGQQVTIQNR